MMRLIPILAAAMLLLPAPATAQVADQQSIAAQQAAMKKLEWMHGVWRGPATTQGEGGAHSVTQTERIGPFLDGLLTVVEGKGYNADGSVGFHAFGVVSYDPAQNSYWIESHALGRAGKFKLTPTDSGYVWDVPAGPATIRYTATLSGESWTEVGDYVVSGQPPRRFFTMTLTRVGDTDWPEAGGVAMEASGD